MREIKFRAWDKKDKELLSPDTIGEMLYHAAHGLDLRYAADNFIYMQFTGLKDKNGKEIYEGDIISWNKMKTQKGEVYFEKGRFWVRDFYAPSQDEPSDAFSEGLVLLEIIGNIYENPELLDKDK